MMKIHPASQVEASKHSKTVLELTKLHPSRNLVEHIVRETVDTVDEAVGSLSSSRGRRDAGRPEVQEFAEFAASVIARAEVPTAVLLVTLIYIYRSRPHLSVEAEEWALHRVFLGALMLASKFTNDSTLQNVHWAIATGIFGKRDVGRIEREFLDVLDWDLTVSENEVADLYPSIIALYPRAQQVVVSPPRPARCPTFTLDPISYDSDVSSSSAASSPRTPCDSEKITEFVKYEPSKHDDLDQTRQNSRSKSRWSQNQKLISALVSEYCPVMVA